MSLLGKQDQADWVRFAQSLGIVMPERWDTEKNPLSVSVLWRGESCIARFHFNNHMVRFGDFEAECLGRLHVANVERIPRIVQQFGHVSTRILLLKPIIGESVKDRIANALEKRWRPRSAARFCLRLSTVLRQIHACGIIHRDLSAGNVLVATNVPGAQRRRGRRSESFEFAGLIDFGHASSLAAPDTRMSGTAGFACPEQAAPEGHNQTAAIDVWGLGSLYYCLLVGTDDPSELSSYDGNWLEVHQRRRPEFAALSKDQAAVIWRCRQRAPDARPSMQEMEHEFARAAVCRPSKFRQLGRLKTWALEICSLRAHGLLLGLVVFTSVLLLCVRLGWTRLEAEASRRQQQDNKMLADVRLFSRDLQSGQSELRLNDIRKAATGSDGSPRVRALAERMLRVHHAVAPQLVRNIHTTNDAAALALASDGSIFSFDRDGVLRRYRPDGFGDLEVALPQVTIGSSSPQLVILPTNILAIGWKDPDGNQRAAHLDMVTGSIMSGPSSLAAGEAIQWSDDLNVWAITSGRKMRLGRLTERGAPNSIDLPASWKKLQLSRDGSFGILEVGVNAYFYRDLLPHKTLMEPSPALVHVWTPLVSRHHNEGIYFSLGEAPERVIVGAKWVHNTANAITLFWSDQELRSNNVGATDAAQFNLPANLNSMGSVPLGRGVVAVVDKEYRGILVDVRKNRIASEPFWLSGLTLVDKGRASEQLELESFGNGYLSVFNLVQLSTNSRYTELNRRSLGPGISAFAAMGEEVVLARSGQLEVWDTDIKGSRALGRLAPSAERTIVGRSIVSVNGREAALIDIGTGEAGAPGYSGEDDIQFAAADGQLVLLVTGVSAEIFHVGKSGSPATAKWERLWSSTLTSSFRSMAQSDDGARVALLGAPEKRGSGWVEQVWIVELASAKLSKTELPVAVDARWSMRFVDSDRLAVWSVDEWRLLDSDAKQRARAHRDTREPRYVDLRGGCETGTLLLQKGNFGSIRGRRYQLPLGQLKTEIIEIETIQNRELRKWSTNEYGISFAGCDRIRDQSGNNYLLPSMGGEPIKDVASRVSEETLEVLSRFSAGLVTASTGGEWLQLLHQPGRISLNNDEYGVSFTSSALAMRQDDVWVSGQMPEPGLALATSFHGDVFRLDSRPGAVYPKLKGSVIAMDKVDSAESVGRCQTDPYPTGSYYGGNTIEALVDVPRGRQVFDGTSFCASDPWSADVPYTDDIPLAARKVSTLTLLMNNQRYLDTVQGGSPSDVVLQVRFMAKGKSLGVRELSFEQVNGAEPDCRQPLDAGGFASAPIDCKPIRAPAVWRGRRLSDARRGQFSAQQEYFVIRVTNPVPEAVVDLIQVSSTTSPLSAPLILAHAISP